VNIGAAGTFVARRRVTAAELARESLTIAGQIDIYTNDSITLEEL